MNEMGPLAAFTMEYQPVVSLADGAVHHYEALARFGDGSEPGQTIRRAEDLDLIIGFDLVAAGRVAEVARATPGLIFASNISARSLLTDGFVDALLAQVSVAAPGALMFEITETAELGD